MINNPEMIDELLKKFNSIPKEVIKKAIKEVIEEDSEIELMDEIKIDSYNVKEEYIYDEMLTNVYVHNDGTSKNIFSKILNIRKNDFKEGEAA